MLTYLVRIISRFLLTLLRKILNITLLFCFVLLCSVLERFGPGEQLHGAGDGDPAQAAAVRQGGLLQCEQKNGSGCRKLYTT